MASGHPLFCCVSVGGELFGALARRHFAPPHPIGNQNPAFLVTELSANPIGNQKQPFLVTELSANPIGNQKHPFLVTELSSHPIGAQKPALLVTELSANPIGNQKHPFLVTDEENCRDLFLKIKVFGNKFVYWGHAAISAVD